MAVLSINRSNRSGSFTPQEILFAKSMLPHFRSAYSIMRRLSWLEQQVSTIGTAIDRMNVGMILLDRVGCVTYQNEAAHLAMNPTRGLSLATGGVLKCANQGDQSELRIAVRLAASENLTSPIRIYVHDTQGQIGSVLVVTMVHHQLEIASLGKGSAVAVFIHLPTQVDEAASAILTSAFGLTPAEARLAVFLAEGHSPIECSEFLGVSIATIRSQLRSLFAKTGTEKQAVLLAALEFALRAR
jgi:DNA-binding CsgD family transcriptional regulator